MLAAASFFLAERNAYFCPSHPCVGHLCATRMKPVLDRLCRFLCPILCAACAALWFVPGAEVAPTPAQRLVLAVGIEPMRTVRSLLDSGIDMNSTVPIHGTALHRAARNGCTETVELLLSRGAKPDPANDLQNTPLWMACAAGHADVVKLLIAAGADVNRRCNGDVTPLIVAASSGDTDTIRALVDAGAELDARDDSGLTALDQAKQDHNKSAVQLLSTMERRCAASRFP